jgi:hypothetical protein
MTGPDGAWAHGSYEEIAALVALGTGSRAGFDAVEAWKRARRTLVDCDALITRAYVDAGAGWSGDAYAAFRASMGPITQWVADATTEASNTAIAVDMQGAHADEVKVRLPPAPEPGAPAAVTIAATEDAQRLAQNYVTRTSQSQQQLSSWTQPPSVTVQVPVPGSARRAAVRDPAGTVAARAGGLISGGAGASGVAASGGATSAATSGAGVAANGPEAAGGVTGSPGARSGQLRAGSPGSSPASLGNGIGPDVAGSGSAGNRFGGIAAAPAGVGDPGSAGAQGGGARGGTGAAPPFGPGSVAGADRAGGGVGSPRGPAADLPAPFVPGAPGAVGTSVSPGHRTVPGYGAVEALPPGAGGRGRRPPDPAWSVPGRETASRAPSWRDVVAAEPVAAEPAGSRSGTAERSGMYPPMMGTGAGAGQGGSRRRPDFLVDDSGAFTDDRWFPGPVIGPDDPLPPR